MPQHLVIVEAIKTNRVKHNLDRICCNKGKLTYECVWRQSDDKCSWCCIFAIFTSGRISAARDSNPHAAAVATTCCRLGKHRRTQRDTRSQRLSYQTMTASTRSLRETTAAVLSRGARSRLSASVMASSFLSKEQNCSFPLVSSVGCSVHAADRALFDSVAGLTRGFFAIVHGEFLLRGKHRLQPVQLGVCHASS